MNRIATLLWLSPIAIVMGVTSCHRLDAPPAQAGARPVKELRAGCAALAQFAKDLQAQPPENDFQRFAALPDSYTFVVRESPDSYTFYFGLKSFHGRPVIDEGIAYKVDKDDLKTVRVAPH